MVSLTGPFREASGKLAMFKAVLKKNRDGGKGSKKDSDLSSPSLASSRPRESFLELSSTTVMFEIVGYIFQ
ncbi:hypothetical protein NQZ68_004435 [Dissostichus eleginoides]|nr:hypothetical protein NQZ68_004435 [Dissostichus eleginoides]